MTVTMTMTKLIENEKRGDLMKNRGGKSPIFLHKQHQK